MKTITIEVTQQDIDSGVPSEPTSCPIALAARRAGFTRVSVGPDDDNEWELSFCYGSVALPSTAVEFAEMFDVELEVVPFSFDITVLE